VKKTLSDCVSIANWRAKQRLLKKFFCTLHVSFLQAVKRNPSFIQLQKNKSLFLHCSLVILFAESFCFALNQNQKVLFKVGTFYNNQHKLSRAFQTDMHNRLHKLNTAQ
jgi:hypothetical protein